jgi:ATP-dependent DNA helicase PIF1
VRQALPLDPDLALGRAAPPVMPPRHRSRVVAIEPPIEPRIEPPIEPPIESPLVASAPLLEPAVETTRTAPAASSLWDPPVPTFTYLSGAAGSGKTFACKDWAEREQGLLLCATTGIAAINLGGETINSVLGYFDTHSLQEQFIAGFLTARLGKLWRAGVRRLIVDEVSMLAAEQLTCLTKAVEEVNGRGYVLGRAKDDDDDDDTPPPQMGLTLVGDFLQLAPVKAKYAFESPEWERFAPHIVTLSEIRRQADADFIAMLRAARLGQGAVVAEYFASRGAIQQETDDHYDGPTIVAKNESVDRYNYLRLSQLTGKDVTWTSTRWGKLRSEWGTLDKPEHTWGIPKQLSMKIGALVMILSNQRDDLRRLLYVNGDLGTLVDATAESAWVELQRTGDTVEVTPVHRDVRIPCDSARKKELRAANQAHLIDGKWEIAGGITYLPLRVAYASTVHKSQGLSLDKVQVNCRDHFFKTPGMMYVALSRARNADGLRLVGSPKAIVERCVSDPRLRAWL